jgi:tetratricopeptide (TPR) repeat protein
VLVVNPGPQHRHIEPVELRDALYQRLTDDELELEEVAASIAGHVRALIGALGDVRPLRRPPWFGFQPLGSTRFVGRLDAMWRIHSALHAADYAPLTASTGAGVAEIRGLAGVGKTLVAEEYALRFGSAYPGGIFWLRAFGADAAPGAPAGADQERQRQGQFRALAETLLPGLVSRDSKPEEIEGLIRSWIAEQDLPCLWVVDDLPSGLTTEEVRRWLPPHPLARTLLTTRSDRYQALAADVELGLLTADEGYELLTAGRRPEGAEEEGGARAIVSDLGRHALAIDVAGAALAGSVMWRSFAEFHQALMDPDADGLELAAEFADELPSGHSPSIATTLLASIDVLGDEGRDFMWLASTLSSAPIPLQLAEAVIRRLDGVTPADARLWLARALKQADSQSLTAQSDDEGAARSVHPLVARAVRFRAQRSERWQQIRAAVIATLLAELPRVEDVRAHKELTFWVAHARAISTLANLDETRLLLWVGRYDYARGDYASARAIEEAVLEARKPTLSSDDHDMLIGRSDLARTLRAQGDLEGAREHYEEVLRLRELQLGPEHREALSAHNNLAEVLGDLGDLTGARMHHEAVFRTRERLLGLEHADTLTSGNNLASKLLALGDLPGARRLYEAVLDARRRILGDDHADTLSTRGNLAAVLESLGDLDGARAHEEAVLEVRERMLGPEHPDTLISRNNLATTFYSLRKFAEAAEQFATVLEARQRLLGREHLDTLTARNNLASALLAQGDAEAARDHHEAVLEVRRRALGPEHPDTLVSRNNLAHALHALGELEASREHGQAVLEARERILGPDHPDTLTSRNNLAHTLRALGDLDHARIEQRAAVEGFRRVLGPEHPRTLDAERTLAELAELSDARNEDGSGGVAPRRAEAEQS